MEKHWQPDEHSQEMPKIVPADTQQHGNEQMKFAKPKFDRGAYQREYMKLWRAAKKLKQ